MSYNEINKEFKGKLYCYISNTKEYAYKYSPLIVPYKSNIALFNLIDEDLTNALHTLVPKGNELVMNIEEQIEMARNEGYKKGYENAIRDTESKVNYNAAIRPKNLYASENKGPDIDSRIQAELLPRLYCPGCKIELCRYDMKHGLVYEHNSGYPTGCTNEGKYFYTKRKLRTCD